MADLFAFISGFSACAALWLLRERERRRAFEGAADEIKALRKRELRYRQTLGAIKALAWRAHIERLQSLGGTALLPAAAGEKTGQRLILRRTARLTGPSRGGPDF